MGDLCKKHRSKTTQKGEKKKLMADAINLDSELRGEQALRLLADPLFQEAFEVLKKDLISRWESSGVQELEARESIWLAMRLLDKLYNHISSIAETGHMNKVLMQQHPFI